MTFPMFLTNVNESVSLNASNYQTSTLKHDLTKTPTVAFVGDEVNPPSNFHQSNSMGFAPPLRHSAYLNSWPKGDRLDPPGKEQIGKTYFTWKKP